MSRSVKDFVTTALRPQYQSVTMGVKKCLIFRIVIHGRPFMTNKMIRSWQLKSLNFTFTVFHNNNNNNNNNNNSVFLLRDNLLGWEEYLHNYTPSDAFVPRSFAVFVLFAGVNNKMVVVIWQVSHLMLYNNNNNNNNNSKERRFLWPR